MDPFIEIKDLSFEYKAENENIKAIDNLSLDIYSGEFLSILGHNGCGKSTLAKTLNALLVPTNGKVLVDGLDTSDTQNKYDIRSKVGLIMQNPDNQTVTNIVEEDVAFGPENLGFPPEEIRKKVDQALRAVSMYDYRRHDIDKLSGGQKQRVAIAGILAMSPKCIVLDEPTAMLDPKGRDEVMSIIKKLNREKGVTIILITHYMEEALFSDRIVVMGSGRILLSGSARAVFSNIDILKKNRLTVPQSIELINRLRNKGYNLKSDVLTEEECICELERLFEGKV